MLIVPLRLRKDLSFVHLQSSLWLRAINNLKLWKIKQYRLLYRPDHDVQLISPSIPPAFYVGFFCPRSQNL